METKEQLVESIKEWIAIDEEMKLLRKELKERRERQKNLTHNLVEVMKNNEIDAFDINEGKLLYSKRTTKQPLSNKLLLSSLQKLYENNDEAEKVMQHILESREEKIKEIIRRKIIKT
jgi:hypothetical protein|tara:strand:- start:3494 stop:3847 length:354 start_codon:yes stop_codon:yes gene_type:complete